MKSNKKIVFTNGCFDIIHVGHIRLLEKAKSFGDYLIVGLNSDKSVKMLKGNDRPYNNEKNRKFVLESIKYVDEVLIFDEKTPSLLIEEIKPDVLVKGGDYTIENIVGADFILNNGGEVKIVPIIEGFSSTNYIDKLK
jgi:rfaE bifunctional protein nucleotidyltransferase chain/domain